VVVRVDDMEFAMGMGAADANEGAVGVECARVASIEAGEGSSSFVNDACGGVAALEALGVFR
jgi:hypothetical protein